MTPPYDDSNTSNTSSTLLTLQKTLAAIEASAANDTTSALRALEALLEAIISSRISNTKLFEKTLCLGLHLALQDRASASYLTLIRIGSTEALRKNWSDVMLTIANQARLALQSKILNSDERLALLAACTELYSSIGNYGEASRLMQEGATIYADLGAFQSAFRLLNDAHQLALTNNNLREAAECLSRHGQFCLLEGDLAEAEDSLNKAAMLFERLTGSVPIEVGGNQATMLMRRQRWEDAHMLLTALLADASAIPLRSELLLNKSICLRHLGRIEEAGAAYESASKIAEDELHAFPFFIELELQAVNLAVANDDYPSAILSLQHATFYCRQQLSTTARLHYRRGMREAYNRRLAAAIASLPESGSIDDVLIPLCTIAQTSLSDWLTIKTWVECLDVSDDKSKKERQAVYDTFDALIEYGAPITHWFQEKYDDAWQGSLSPDVIIDMRQPAWENFSAAATQYADTLGIDTPWKLIADYDPAQYLAETLANHSHALIVSAVEDRLHIYHLTTTSYRRVTLTLDPFIDHMLMLASIQDGTIPAHAFLASLDAISNLLRLSLASTLETIWRDEPVSILIFPSHVDVPFISMFIGDQSFRNYARKLAPTVAIVPILYHGDYYSRQDRLSYFGAWRSDQRLGLDFQELKDASDALDSRPRRIVDMANQDVDLGDIKADVIHLACHGRAISSFIDPLAGGLLGAEDSLIGNDQLQRTFPGLPYRLAFLNSCHGADTINHTRDRTFRSEENIGLPSLLMLNGLASVVAPRWGTYDTVAYVFARFFFCELYADQSPGRAYIHSLLRLYDLTKSELLDLLGDLPDDGELEKRIAIFRGAAENPFQNAYVSGCYQLFTLLRKYQL